MFRQPGPGSGSGYRPSSTNSSLSLTRDRDGFQPSLFDDTTHILILLVVLVPVIFTILLCTVTYCIYRYNKKRSERAPTNAPIVPVDRTGAPIATVVYNSHHSPFMFEELPPSYDSLANAKKDLSSATTHEQVQLTVLPPTTISTEEHIAPPSYIQLSEPDK